jgi:geranylgeranylglycerol-phosphate geranylgeranyltransferase
MMLSYLKILRPSVVLLTIIAVTVGALVGHFVFGYQQIVLLAVSIVVASLVCGAGNVVNDYFDYKIDKINKPKRPIPSGKIKRKAAAIYAVLLYAIAIVLSLVFLNLGMIVLTVFNTVVTVAYSWKVKRTVLGHFMDSWLASSAFVFGSLLSSFNIAVLFLFSVSYLGNLGREITKGIEDMEGDKKDGAKTLAVMGGRMFASWAAIFFVILAIMISLIPYFFNIFGIGYLVLVTVADAIFVFSCFILTVNPKKSQKIMKIAMFVALAAFLAGVY